MLSVAAIFLAVSAQPQVRAIEETEEQARSRLARELAAQPEEENTVRTIFKTILIFHVLTLLATSLAVADCAKCKYAKRGDRWEGVRVRQVSGASFELLSVEIQPAGKVATGGDQVRLWFWLPGQETPTIEVWEPRTNYWMVPEPRAFAAGRQSYAWPRGEVLAPLGIDPASLRPKIRNRDKTLYYPALVTTSSRPEPGGGYAFVFRSGAGIDVFCTVSRDEGGKLTPVRKFRFSEDFGGVLRIPWDGRDDQGKPVPEGVYVLRLKGEMLAETIPENLLSVAAVFLAASSQAQVRVTHETDEQARSRLALELAAQLTAKLPQLVERFQAGREVIALAEARGTDPMPLVRELLDSTEAELRGEVDSPDYAPLRDKVAAVFQGARVELGLLDAKSTYRRLPPGVAFAAFSRQGADREKVLGGIGSFLRQFLDLAQGKDLVVDLCVVSQPLKKAVLNMNPPSEPLSITHGRSPTKLLHLFRGLYAYSIEGKDRPAIKCQPPQGTFAPCLADLWTASKPTLDCDFDHSDCSVSEGWPAACGR